MRDKGSSSTKILLQVLNVKSESQHSTRFAKLIGIFEGDKHSWECVEAIFGDLIRSVQENCNRIKSLYLKCYENFNCTHQSTENNSAHSSNSSDNCQSTSSINVNGSQNLSSCLTQLDNTIVYMSSNCKHCQSLQSSTAVSDNSNFIEGASYSVEKEKCNCEFQTFGFRERLGMNCNNSWFNRGKRASVLQGLFVQIV